jgi:uncharacterized membrane protein HdeD (DUF308 family)
VTKFSKGDFMNKKIGKSGNKLEALLGLILIALGLAGLGSPTLVGTHLTTGHDVIFLITGLLALAYGLKAKPENSRTLCIVFGIFYFALGTAGFIIGANENLIWRVIPNSIELGLRDHILHIILGLAFIAASLAGVEKSDASDSLPRIHRDHRDRHAVS